MLREVLGRLAYRVRLEKLVLQARLVRREQLDPQVLRAIRESQVLRDLSVIQDQSERLDRLVSQVRQDRRESKE